MINLKGLRNLLVTNCKIEDKRITIKRKKKMALIKTTNGVKTKRINYIKIEIIE